MQQSHIINPLLTLFAGVYGKVILLSVFIAQTSLLRRSVRYENPQAILSRTDLAVG